MAPEPRYRQFLGQLLEDVKEATSASVREEASDKKALRNNRSEHSPQPLLSLPAVCAHVVGVYIAHASQ